MVYIKLTQDIDQKLLHPQPEHIDTCSTHTNADAHMFAIKDTINFEAFIPFDDSFNE